MKKSILTIALALVCAVAQAQVVRFTFPTYSVKENVQNIKEMTFVPGQDFSIYVSGQLTLEDNSIEANLTLGTDAETAEAFVLTEEMYQKHKDYLDDIKSRYGNFYCNADMISEARSAGICVPMADGVANLIPMPGNAYKEQVEATKERYTVFFLTTNKYIPDYFDDNIDMPEYSGNTYIYPRTMDVYNDSNLTWNSLGYGRWIDDFWYEAIFDVEIQQCVEDSNIYRFACPYTDAVTGGGATYQPWIMLTHTPAGYVTWKDAFYINTFNSSYGAEVKAYLPSALSSSVADSDYLSYANYDWQGGITYFTIAPYWYIDGVGGYGTAYPCYLVFPGQSLPQINGAWWLDTDSNLRSAKRRLPRPVPHGKEGIKPARN